ncbi:MAG: two-component hybrid sensor and regulator [Bacteroidetes bacterium]|jgi:DNA-binding LytR/AlgR family response regulator|nr:two-component hybrid sensor and regulator [Bacteroidota bacterium]MDF2451777.1 two-component hybrid sensor and regulator [Bacteroidota bacterium]
MIAASIFLIVEDELLIAETISDFLKAEGCKEILIAESVDEATDILNSSKIDFVLTDIALGKEQTGIDLGNLLNSKYHLPFIYITSHADKAMIDKAKHTHPKAYIIKPFKKEDLLVAIELALYNLENSPIKTEESEELIVKEGRALVKLHHQSIVWLEADGNYTTIHLKNDKRKVIRIALSELEQQLPSVDFIRIHKSYLVNKKYITEMKSGSIIVNNEELSVGRTYQQNLNSLFK